MTVLFYPPAEIFSGMVQPGWVKNIFFEILGFIISS